MMAIIILLHNFDCMVNFIDVSDRETVFSSCSLRCVSIVLITLGAYAYARDKIIHHHQ